MIGLATSGLIALIDAGEPDHQACHQALSQASGKRFTTDFVLAEVDDLILKRLGVAAEQAFVTQVLQGAIIREQVLEADLERALGLIKKYQDHPIGLSDATLAALCERLKAKHILTLDRGHFQMFRGASGRPFKLLP